MGWENLLMVSLMDFQKIKFMLLKNSLKLCDYLPSFSFPKSETESGFSNTRVYTSYLTGCKITWDFIRYWEIMKYQRKSQNCMEL